MRTENLHFIACLVYGATGILVFSTSALLHFLEDGFTISPRLARKLEDLDFISIYLFIAGTYTPILLNTLSDPWKYPILGFIWFLAVAGIVYTLGKAKFPRWAQHRMISTGLYVLMGWMLVFKLHDIVSHMSHLGSNYLLRGSLSYSIGAVIFATKRPVLFKNFFGSHELWHILVTVGFAYHYFMILNLYL